MSTKGDVASIAFAELRISGLVVVPDSGEVADAITRMDMMVADWGNYGLCLEYTDSVGGDINPSQLSGLDRSQELSVALNLAVELAPRYGKAVHPQTLAKASNSFNGLFSVDIGQRERSGYQPSGSGLSCGFAYNERHRFQNYTQGAPDRCSTYKLKLGQTKNITVDLSDETGGAAISSFTIVDGGGVEVLSGSQSNGIFTLECVASDVGYTVVKITLTLATGEINPVTLDFDVTEK